jgi:hypothetical protein
MIIEYNKLKETRTTNPENVFENRIEWEEVKDKAYIALRDQCEEFLSQRKNPEAMMDKPVREIYKENKELKARGNTCHKSAIRKLRYYKYSI